MRIWAWLFTGWLISIFVPNDITLLFLYVPLAVLIYVIPLRMAFRSLDVHIVEWDAELNGGENFVFTLNLKNGWPLPLLNIKAGIHLENKLNQQLEQFELVFDVNPFTNRLLTWNCSPLPRGKYQMTTLTLTGRDFFGLVGWQRTQKITGEITVLPTILPLTVERYQEVNTREKHKQHVFGNNSNMSAGIRNYNLGDSMAKIHWKATARMGKLLSREFTGEIGEISSIVLGYGGSSEEENEALITAGASLAWAYFQKGREFRFLLYDQHQVDLGCIYTREDLKRLLDNLTLAVPKIERVALEGLAAFLLQALDSREGELILLTALAQGELPENISEIGYKTIVVTLPPELTPAGIREALEAIGLC